MFELLNSEQSENRLNCKTSRLSKIHRTMIDFDIKIEHYFGCSAIQTTQIHELANKLKLLPKQNRSKVLISYSMLVYARPHKNYIAPRRHVASPVNSSTQTLEVPSPVNTKNGGKCIASTSTSCS